MIQDVFLKTLEFAVPVKNRLAMDLRGSWYHDCVKMICTTECQVNYTYEI